MDKETLSNYGWIVICVLVLAVMIALATPFGKFVSNAVQNTTQGLFDTNEKALKSTGLINIDHQEFDTPDTNKTKNSDIVLVDGVEYENIAVATEAINANETSGTTIKLTGNTKITSTLNIKKSITIDGDGYTIARNNLMRSAFTDKMFVVDSGTTLTLNNIKVDGGAVWSGKVDEVLLRGTENTGIVATGSIIETAGSGNVVLNAGTVLKNNDGQSAITLATRGGGSVTINGAHIINNTSAGGAAIWGGGNVTINSGSKLNGNLGTSIGGAIRMVHNSGTITMNGGEINHNKSNGTGGAIYGGDYSNAKGAYIFTGGEIAHNYATTGGGALWTGVYETVTISGTFEMHDNVAGELGGAIRFCDHTTLEMTGGKIYNNTANGISDAFFLNNNSAVITGGTIEDDFTYAGSLGLTIGEATITGKIAFKIETVHNTVYLAEKFNAVKFTVNEGNTNFASFNFKPSANYTYAEGDETKFVCENEGYEIIWDATNSVFKISAK